IKGHSDNSSQKAYIGESENIAERLRRHDKKRKDWDTAVVFTTTGAENQLTKADIKYLENYCYQKALEAERFSLEQNTPTKSFVHESREADLMDMYKSITDLLTFLGFQLFLPLTDGIHKKDVEDIYYITNRDADARATYSQDGMTVLKGSKTAPQQTKSFQSGKLYNELVESKVIDKHGVFVKDYTFTKPSTAAMIVLRASANGWTMWKDKNGKTLDENVERK